MKTHDDASDYKRYEANQLFHEAYEAQRANDYDRAIELYKFDRNVSDGGGAHVSRLGLQFSGAV